MKPELLFLCHRIPYPPNKGDKIRSWHLFEELGKDFRIHLGTFIDDPADTEYIPYLDSLCTSSCYVRLSPALARVRSLPALLTGRSLSEYYYHSRALHAWVRSLLRREAVSRALVFSSPMAQYVLKNAGAFERKIIDFVDVDSDKWSQYARTRKKPMDLVYRREADKLLAFDREVARDFDYSFFVSREEAELFAGIAPESATKVRYFSNGVDLDYFRPSETVASPYTGNGPILVFTGAMNYWPNVDAACWFAREIFPSVRARYPDVEFFVVGANPAPEVRRLGDLEGVTVTGTVADVRPYIQHASAAVVPMRIARGIQNKVLEAMAMARPLVATTQGLEGINPQIGRDVVLADDAAAFGAAVNDLLSGEYPELGASARQFVMEGFHWQENIRPLRQLLHNGPESLKPESLRKVI
jgi:sugar transferase (PEP-CTERM/EpsH1 system associated)